MAQFALYRKYRSQTFSDLMGQDHVVRILQNAVQSGRVAQSYLFTGPRGTGKTSSARLLAKSLNCLQRDGVEPCNECSNCLDIASGSSMDVLEMDAASEAGVDEVREKIVAASEYMPSVSRYRIFIIDEVHDLSPKAFDALLKTIEEPPAHVIFILATTEYHKVPATIRSRCQKFEFHRAKVSQLADRIRYVASAEGVEIEPLAVLTIARIADGGYRDALSLLEQVLLTSDGTLTQAHVIEQLGLIQDETIDELLLGMTEHNPEQVLRALDAVVKLGRDPRTILEAGLARLSDLTRSLYSVDSLSPNDATIEAATRETATKLGVDGIAVLRESFSSAHRYIRDVTLPRLWLESWLLTATQARPEVPVPAPAAPPERTAPSHQEVATAKPEPAAKPKLEATNADPWTEVVGELSQVSKLAKVHLERSKITSETEKEVVVGLRAMDLEWVLSKPKVHGAILEAWKARDARKLTLAAAGNGHTPDTTHAAVELPAEGEKLHQLLKDTFEGM